MTSVIFGVLLLGEKVTPLKIVACILIFAGVLILSFAKENTKDDLLDPDIELEI
nr:hypothetical protein [uncultured Romboutsia sp.]